MKASTFVDAKGAACNAAVFMTSYSLDDPKFWVMVGDGLAETACSQGLSQAGATLMNTLGYPMLTWGLVQYVCGGAPLKIKVKNIIKDKDVRSIAGKAGKTVRKKMWGDARQAVDHFVQEMQEEQWHD